MPRVPYPRAVDSIMYTIVCSRPNICRLVAFVSRCMEFLGKARWKTMKWILIYVNGIIDIVYQRDDNGSKTMVHGYSNHTRDLNEH